MTRTATNGCDYRLQLDGTLRAAGSAWIPSLTVRAEVSCPNGARWSTQRLVDRSDPLTAPALTDALRRAAEVTETNGSDRCVYAPTVVFDAKTWRADRVVVACITRLDRRDSD
jgi:hypothetical protein